MDAYSFVEGPLLRAVFCCFAAGVIARFAFFAYSVLRDGPSHRRPWNEKAAAFARCLVPFHMGAFKKPLYAAPRYLFHGCVFIVPVWLGAHVVLLSESGFEWEWTPMPEVWADRLTLVVIAFCVFFLLRRVTAPEIRRSSSATDYGLIVITGLPFVTGYLLSHGPLDTVPFFAGHMATIHAVSGEVMILTAVVLFCRTRINARTCTGCAACEIRCPTGTLETNDRGRMRVFSYSHYRCICCGACVGTCPEGAAELRHEISPVRFAQVAPAQDIRSVEMEACRGCGALFAPVPQMEKAGTLGAYDYLHFCPECRKIHAGELLRRLSPWHGTWKGGPHANEVRN